MFDIRAIRDNPDAFRAAFERKQKGLGEVVSHMLDHDAAVRKAVSDKQEAEAARNAKSKHIGQAKASGDEALFEQLRAEVAEAKQVIEAAGEQEVAAREELNKLLYGTPNLPMPDVPEGEDEAGNLEQHKWGEPNKRLAGRNNIIDHADLGVTLGMMDFETAAKMSGARFVLLSGKLARLERALATYMLDTQSEQNGYTECSPPFMVRANALIGTGQLPKFEEELFKTDSGHYTIPTSEVPLTNIVADHIIDQDYLPRRYTAHTPCFRSEAGSAGRDTKGMIRLHQFNKVEMVSIVRGEDEGLAELERMTKCAEGILEALDLPYRRVLLCTGDMGFGARKTYDLEVWLPSQNTYREISSCSYCGDFQARRMNARWRPAPSEDVPKPKPEFVHTLNGSGLAVGRTLVAVLENYQNEDGSITVPDVIRPYMGGLDRIS
ncbi:MAG: serine--tRNA ligase [Pseudomonadota bacterium]